MALVGHFDVVVHFNCTQKFRLQKSHILWESVAFLSERLLQGSTVKSSRHKTTMFFHKLRALLRPRF